jgi:hypothetical protein
MASAWLQPCLVSPSYGTAEQAAEKASNRVILSGAKDLLFVYFQGETTDASCRLQRGLQVEIGTSLRSA